MYLLEFQFQCRGRACVPPQRGNQKKFHHALLYGGVQLACLHEVHGRTFVHRAMQDAWPIVWPSWILTSCTLSQTVDELRSRAASFEARLLSTEKALLDERAGRAADARAHVDLQHRFAALEKRTIIPVTADKCLQVRHRVGTRVFWKLVLCKGHTLRHLKYNVHVHAKCGANN